MPRPKSERTKRDRSRQPDDGPRPFIRRPTLARETDTTEGWWRLLESRGDGPRVIRIGRLVLYDREEAFAWLRRNASTPTASWR